MSNLKEAQARIKINRLLEESGWRFEDSKDGGANIQLEANVKFNELNEDLDNAVTSDGRHGAIDFLLLDKDGQALVVIEAKKETIDPLSAKDQARNYARNKSARFVILSNGNIHYFWDTKNGNPEIISRFPTQESLSQYRQYIPNPNELAEAVIDENYVVASQMPSYSMDPSFINETTRRKFLKDNNLRQLRPYQVQAIKTLQESARSGNQRFLFEMATGTGKTLVSAATIRLFLKTGNARRVLFLVDRLELEDQAKRALIKYLGKDYRCVVFKENKDSWRNAEVVISTIQSFLSGDRYKKEFSPTDFEFVISDEAHRSIGGNSRVVFEYFVGYKLGLTATPKNYLRGFDSKNTDNQREYERRLLIDTYKTFGCESGQPTFSYDLERGAKEGFLIKPTLVDARTDITTQLLSNEGYAVHAISESGESIDEVFNEKHYERKLFNEETNVAMCRALIENGLYDPVAKAEGVELFGKTIVFAVSQSHAARLTNILNKIAMEKWPERYNQSDFAEQVSSQVIMAQQKTINFSNNTLGGKVSFPEGYDSGKTRVCVTVGMMTTGYDCQDLLNVALMRPLFSPTDFVQIKGRGTRKWIFEYDDYKSELIRVEKDKFKFFDFFASCEYFENEFNYDEKIKLPYVGALKIGGETIDIIDVGDDGITKLEGVVSLGIGDKITEISETPEGVIMRIDREGFKRATEEDVAGNEELKNLWDSGAIQEAEDFVKKHIFDKPKHFLNLDKIKKLFGVDRRITIREFLQVAFGEKEGFEMKDDLLESEWEKFVDIYGIDQEHYKPVKALFKAYITDKEVRDIVDAPNGELWCRLYYTPSFTFEEFQACNGYRKIIPQYIHDYAYQLTNL